MKTIVALITSSILTLSVLVCKAEDFYTKSNVKEGLVFQMEINSAKVADREAFCRQYNPDKIHHMQYVWYQFGDFESNAHAQAFLEEFKELFPQTHVIAFLNKTKIPMYYAQMLDNIVQMCQNNALKYSNTGHIHKEEVNHIIDLKKTGKKYYYAVVVPANSIKAVDQILDTQVETRVEKLNDRQSVFVIGSYTNTEDAISLRNQLIEKGIEQVHLIACLKLS